MLIREEDIDQLVKRYNRFYKRTGPQATYKRLHKQSGNPLNLRVALAALILLGDLEFCIEEMSMSPEDALRLVLED